MTYLAESYHDGKPSLITRNRRLRGGYVKVIHECKDSRAAAAAGCPCRAKLQVENATTGTTIRARSLWQPVPALQNIHHRWGT